MSSAACPECRAARSTRHHACRNGLTWCPGDRRRAASAGLARPSQPFAGSRACANCGGLLGWRRGWGPAPWLPRLEVVGLALLFGTLFGAGLTWLMREPAATPPAARSPALSPSVNAELAALVSSGEAASWPAPPLPVVAEAPAQRPFDRAAVCYERGEWQCVVDVLSVPIDGPPGPATSAMLASAHHFLGRQHLLADRHAAGLRELDLALSIEPRNDQVLRERRQAELYAAGLDRLARREWAEASALFQQVFEADEGYRATRSRLADAHLAWGRELEATARPDEARTHFERVLALNPENLEAGLYVAEARRASEAVAAASIPSSPPPAAAGAAAAPPVAPSVAPPPSAPAAAAPARPSTPASAPRAQSAAPAQSSAPPAAAAAPEASRDNRAASTPDGGRGGFSFSVNLPGLVGVFGESRSGRSGSSGGRSDSRSSRSEDQDERTDSRRDRSR